MTSATDLEAVRTRARAFAQLHDGRQVLVLPNAWDAGSAKLIVRAGFPAVATTSAGIAFSRGLPDGGRLSRDEVFAALRPIVAAVDVPVTVDAETGYGDTPADVADTVRALIAMGAAGCNIEDGTGDPARPLADAGAVAERLRAARRAADEAGIDFVINARTDGFWSGGTGPDVLAEAIRRSNLYLAAGARCAFVPLVTDEAAIATLVREIRGPVNILAGPATPPLPRLAALGVARVSVGGALARTALAAVRNALDDMVRTGTFAFTRAAIPHADVNRMFGP